MRGRWLGCERSECLSRRGWRTARTLTKSSGATTLRRDFAPALQFPSGLVSLLSLPREEKVLLLEQTNNHGTIANCDTGWGTNA